MVEADLPFVGITINRDDTVWISGATRECPHCVLGKRHPEEHWEIETAHGVSHEERWATADDGRLVPPEHNDLEPVVDRLADRIEAVIGIPVVVYLVGG